jgi:hypothetical protein
MLTALAVAVVLATGLVVTAYEDAPDVVMNCQQLWPICRK